MFSQLNWNWLAVEAYEWNEFDKTPMHAHIKPKLYLTSYTSKGGEFVTLLKYNNGQ